MASAYIDFACHQRNTWRAIFEHRLTTESEVPESYREKQAELFQIVEDCLGASISEQERRNVSRTLFGAVHGVISLALDEKLGGFQ